MTAKHENYELLNLIGYGLAKFNMAFVKHFGFTTKTAFYQNIVQLGVAQTLSTVKNRQDLFDPFFENGRKGWWQKGNAYIHRKELIDSLYGTLDVHQFADVIKLYLKNQYDYGEEMATISPIMKSRYKQLQITGQEAELFFMHNYRSIRLFTKGVLEDARLFGDGYDFQIQVDSNYFLAEIKGLRKHHGNIRLTKNEFSKASEYKEHFGLIVVSNLSGIPKMTTIFNPVEKIVLAKKTVSHTQITYHSKAISW